MENGNENGEKYVLVAKTETAIITTHETTDPNGDNGSGREMAAKQFDDREHMKADANHFISGFMGPGAIPSIEQKETDDGEKISTIAISTDVKVNQRTGNPTTTTKIITLVAERVDN